MIRAFLIPAAGLISSAAQGACPVAGDLSTGIRVTFEDGIVIEYTEREPGIVEEAEIDSHDGSIYYIVTERGILEIENYSLFPDSTTPEDFVRFEYDFDKDVVFPLEPGKTDGGKQIMLNATGEEVDQAFIRYSVGNPGRFSVGACDYEMLPVQLNMNRGGSPMVIRLAYLPELDMSVVEGFYEFGYDPVLYEPLTFEVMKKK